MAETAEPLGCAPSLLLLQQQQQQQHQQSVQQTALTESNGTLAGVQRTGNALQRHTSETLRLTEPTLLLQARQFQPVAAAAPLPDSPSPVVGWEAGSKPTSFQITSVTSSISNDGEDDSCGEVDDGQTDASEVGSQRRVEFNLPLEPGLYVNDSDSGVAVTSIGGVPVSLVQQHSNYVGKGAEQDAKGLFQGWQGRFRVVKIESSEPFKRGRWLCMDFLDHPSIQTSLSKDEPGSGASSSASLSSDHFPVHEDLVQQPVSLPLQVTPSASPVLPSCT